MESMTRAQGESRSGGAGGADSEGDTPVGAEITAGLEHLRTKLSPSFDLPAAPQPGKGGERHTDRFIQTLLYPGALEGTLRKISAETRSAVEETGTNMLYLVFGFLEWHEPDSPERAVSQRAPPRP